MAHRQPLPFPPEAALVTDSGQHLPGEPRVRLDNREAVNTFLHRELDDPLFNEIYSWCEILVPKRGDNISSLHRQVVKGRQIITSEDARLHLVWDKHKIYIKPIPACLLSYRVWETCMSDASVREDGQAVEPKNPLSQPVTAASTCSSSAPEYGPPVEASHFSEHLRYPSSSSSSSEETHDVSMFPTFDRKVALGFLRSYAYLIRHASDLKMAREVGLLPEGETPITWTRWAIFISHFQSIPDSAVSRRYEFGHLRMGRLDWAVRMRFVHGLFASTWKTSPDVSIDNDGNIENGVQPTTSTTPLVSKEARKRGPKWYYLQPYWSIPVLLEGMFNYFLFAFATASLLLSAMQVSLAIPPGAYLGLPTSSTASPDSIGGKEEKDTTIPGGKYILGMWRFFWIFANATIYLCGVLCLGMLAMLAYPYLRKVVKVVLRGIWRRRGWKGE